MSVKLLYLLSVVCVLLWPKIEKSRKQNACGLFGPYTYITNGGVIVLDCGFRSLITNQDLTRFSIQIEDGPAYLSDGVHMTIRSPFRYCHQATNIEALTVRKYIGILSSTFPGGTFLCHPQTATA